MGKIKINLSTGVEQEKNVINAFKVGNDSYVVLDNETTGSMGLPIILIAKINTNKLSKIIDQIEWQRTKENLKLIISNSPMEYIVIPSLLSADEVYYTQLTLPQASFDAIKNNYKPVPDGGAVAPILTEEPFVPTVEVTPIITAPSSADASLEFASAPVVVEQVVPVSAPVVMPVEPVIAPVIPVVQVAPVMPVISQPTVNPVIAPVMPDVQVAPIMPEVPVEVVSPVAPSIPVAPIVPEITLPVEPVIAPAALEQPAVAPVIAPSFIEASPAPMINENLQPELVNYNDLKETFMKSCENMFDALIAKLK